MDDKTKVFLAIKNKPVTVRVISEKVFKSVSASRITRANLLLAELIKDKKVARRKVRNTMCYALSSTPESAWVEYEQAMSLRKAKCKPNSFVRYDVMEFMSDREFVTSREVAEMLYDEASYRQIRNACSGLYAMMKSGLIKQDATTRPYLFALCNEEPRIDSHIVSAEGVLMADFNSIFSKNQVSV